jgi:ADP-ribosylglycohydrolase.
MVGFTSYAQNTLKISPDDLMDKIKGGWAGQTIGVVFGAPTEFKFSGTYVQDYQPIPWGKGYVKYWWVKKPGLFDDIYNDCTFAEAFQQLGLDCTSKDLAMRFAGADYHLAHANQMGRYNIKNGIMPPMSGNWKNNPHADDLDFQIEADFIGLMSPAMLPTAMNIADRVGHIMNSGDGFYGGAFVAGLYSSAFYHTDVRKVLDTALELIPQESSFYRCIDDVRKFYDKHPDNWKDCWYFLQENWNKDIGCPKGVFLSFNIDAKLNSAFVATALLYGKGDFTKSVDIAARMGQDSDCNPSTVAGVLGVMKGYNNIPSFWLDPLREIENLNFDGTDVSLASSYQMSFDQAKQLIKRAGGKVGNKMIEIPITKAGVLPLEQNFTEMYPVFRDRKDAFFKDTYEFDFNGNGYVIWGNICCTRHINEDYINRVSTRHIGSEVFGLAEPDDPYVAKIEVWIDGQLDQVALLPMKNTERKVEPAWKYNLPEGKHHVMLKWLNRENDYVMRVNDIVYYSSKPLQDKFYNNNN